MSSSGTHCLHSSLLSPLPTPPSQHNNLHYVYVPTLDPARRPPPRLPPTVTAGGDSNKSSSRQTYYTSCQASLVRELRAKPGLRASSVGKTTPTGSAFEFIGYLEFTIYRSLMGRDPPQLKTLVLPTHPNPLHKLLKSAVDGRPDVGNSLPEVDRGHGALGDALGRELVFLEARKEKKCQSVRGSKERQKPKPSQNWGEEREKKKRKPNQLRSLLFPILTLYTSR